MEKITNFLINTFLCILFFIYIVETVGMFLAKKEFSQLKEKKYVPPMQSVFIENNVDKKNEPQDFEFSFPETKEIKKPLVKIKKHPKADTVVRVAIVEHIIEPKKIAEPVELPEPAVIKIDTTKIKSKIRVSKE